MRIGIVCFMFLSAAFISAMEDAPEQKTMEKGSLVKDFAIGAKNSWNLGYDVIWCECRKAPNFFACWKEKNKSAFLGHACITSSLVSTLFCCSLMVCCTPDKKFQEWKDAS